MNALEQSITCKTTTYHITTLFFLYTRKIIGIDLQDRKIFAATKIQLVHENKTTRCVE